MWPRLQIDLSWSDVTFAFWKGVAASPNANPVASLNWGYNWLACQSERTGFDLLLQALQLPEGSEIAMSALTIPDMANIVRAHGLQPVPIDLQPNSCIPCEKSLASAISPSTRAIVVAHLFGTRVDLSPLIQVARRHESVGYRGRCSSICWQ